MAIRVLSMDPCLYGTEKQLNLHLINTRGLMREQNSISIMDIQIGQLRVTMQESISSSPKMEATGRSRPKEMMSTGLSKSNATKSQAITLKEILVHACMAIRT